MLDLTAERTGLPVDPVVSKSSGVSVSGTPRVLLELPRMLATAESGITFVYDALDRLARLYSLDDALVVIESAAVPRQAFRLGRRPDRPSEGSPIPAVADAPAGLYADPAVIDLATSDYIVNLVEVAIRFDLARHDATRDPLTGLLNRRSYEDALSQAFARSTRYGWPFSLVLLDLDHFKTINDRWGHARGDEALRAFGASIRSCLRRGDVAARVGGDEFALLIHAAHDHHAVSLLVERLRAGTTHGPFESGLRFSAGIAVYPDDALDAVGLSRVADERLYAEKSAIA